MMKKLSIGGIACYLVWMLFGCATTKQVEVSNEYNVSGSVVQCGTMLPLRKVTASFLTKPGLQMIRRPITTGSDGTFTIRLPPGTYTLVLSRAGNESKTVDFSVEDADVTLAVMCL